MFKSIFIASAILATSYAASATETDSIYGWDILCKGPKELVVHAYQSDDDFYIEYKGSKVNKHRVWANAKEQWYLNIKTLRFATDQAVSKGPEVVLTVVRGEPLSEEGYGSGEIVINGANQPPMKCYVRFGIGEEEYDSVARKTFPKF